MRWSSATRPSEATPLIAGPVTGLVLIAAGGATETPMRRSSRRLFESTGSVALVLAVLAADVTWSQSRLPGRYDPADFAPMDTGGHLPMGPARPR